MAKDEAARREPDPNRPPSDFHWPVTEYIYPEFEPYSHSLDLALPVLQLGKAHYYDLQKGHPWLEAYVIAHIIFGHLLILLIALSPTAILRRE